LAHSLEHSAQLVPPLDELLGRVQRDERCGLVDRRRRLARAVAVEVGGEVVGDADQPGPQRATLRLALSALEVSVGLQERLLGEVLCVVMVADAVVGVAVHVAHVRTVEIRELRVEQRLGLLADFVGHSLHPTPASPRAGQAAREISARGASSMFSQLAARAPPSQSH
jgi:hypothetical protein